MSRQRFVVLHGELTRTAMRKKCRRPLGTAAQVLAGVKREMNPTRLPERLTPRGSGKLRRILKSPPAVTA